MPLIVARWRVGPTRILYGESYGGLFVLDALSRGRQAFTDYVAVSPAVGIWPDALASSLCRRFARPAPVRSVTIIYGERDAPLVVDYTPTFVRAITGCTPAELRIEMTVLPGEGHNPASSLEKALCAIFKGDAKGTTSLTRRPARCRRRPTVAGTTRPLGCRMATPAAQTRDVEGVPAT